MREKPVPAVLEKGIVRRGDSFNTRWRENGRNFSKDSKSYWELVAFRADRKAGKRTPRPVEPSQLTFRMHADAYARDKVSSGAWREASAGQHAACVSLLGPLTDKLLGEITDQDVAAWVGTLRRSRADGGHGLAPSTISARVTQARAVFADAVRDGIITRDPSRSNAVRRVMPRVEATRRVIGESEVPTRDQVDALRDALEPRYRVLVTLCATLGLRSGEARGLRVQDVDAARLRVRVEQQLVRKRGHGEVAGPLKTTRSRRVVPTNPEVIAELTEHLAVHRPGARGTDLVLSTGTTRGSLNHGSLEHAWEVANREVFGAGEKGWNVHSLRHYCATSLLAEGTSAVDVAAQLGDSVPMVQSTYAHPDEGTAGRLRAAQAAAAARA